MNNKLYFLSFALGIGVGIYATADYFRAKYKARSDEEIKAVREVYYEKQKEEKTAEKPKEKPKQRLEEMEAMSSLKEKLTPQSIDIDKLTKQQSTYSTLAKEYDTAHPAEKEEPSYAPYVISPDDFGGTFEYDCKSLTYYLDGVLVDEDNNVVKDVEELIGDEALDHIGEYEIDVVHVRNDNLRCDYEILCSDERWVDVKKRWQR